ncbi:phage terminase%2C large subunit%2C PBSX family [Fusicatenibacter saccharivorans]|uniref:Phage terminase, large subunit, PBSX family n=3 Tax=Fusicatenibacter saccharivorans TaxID=1150298 RepID=A0A174R0Z2_9FIRM|nr:phage terminase%2C large subunit%2C PBSX family [Fusicatenibacter saccharivorans]
MANEQNLVQNRSREEAEALSRKGGVASGRARRQKRDLRESMRKILELDISPKQKEQLESLGINSEGWSLGDVVNIMAVQTAMKGNVSAMAYCRDTAGFNPELQLREAQFEYEKKQKSGEGVEIEDVSDIVEKIWGYDQWISMLNDGVPVLLTKQVPYRFSDIHLDYIRKCQDNTYNILEGAVRSGKTVDHVLAFAKELCDTPDKFHLATGSTMANAKLNIGDANGFGLEHIFRGQCRWTSYKDNDALAIRGPYTNFKEKIVIFAGGGSSASYQKIRGNSYGMWIATEINLHHDNTIKEAFNRTIASHRRKIFWDLNPEHPKAPIYAQYIDKYAEKAQKGILKGGYNYAHMTLFDNINISEERREEIISQYDPDSIWYIRDILGERTIAEGLIYNKLATSIAAKDGKFRIEKKIAQAMARSGKIIHINVGVDFGGNGSGHAFVATGELQGYEKLIILKSRRYLEGEYDPDTGKKILDIDPKALDELFIRFIEAVTKEYGFITKVYADSAESVLIRGFRTALVQSGHGDIKVVNAMKSKITDRIFATTALTAMNRLLITEDCESFEQAASMAVWDPKSLELERLDDGTSDIDTLDSFEYSFERDISKFLRR